MRGLFIGTKAVESIPEARVMDPACLLEARERALVLRRAVESLTERQRTVITLSKYEELGNKEIAEIMGTTLVTVESLIHRANKNLRKKLFKYYARQIMTRGENGPPV